MALLIFSSVVLASSAKAVVAISDSVIAIAMAIAPNLRSTEPFFMILDHSFLSAAPAGAVTNQALPRSSPPSSAIEAIPDPVRRICGRPELPAPDNHDSTPDGQNQTEIREKWGESKSFMGCAPRACPFPSAYPRPQRRLRSYSQSAPADTMITTPAR